MSVLGEVSAYSYFCSVFFTAGFCYFHYVYTFFQVADVGNFVVCAHYHAAAYGVYFSVFKVAVHNEVSSYMICSVFMHVGSGVFHRYHFFCKSCAERVVDFAVVGVLRIVVAHECHYVCIFIHEFGLEAFSGAVVFYGSYGSGYSIFRFPAVRAVFYLYGFSIGRGDDCSQCAVVHICAVVSALPVAFDTVFCDVDIDDGIFYIFGALAEDAELKQSCGSAFLIMLTHFCMFDTGPCVSWYPKSFLFTIIDGAKV